MSYKHQTGNLTLKSILWVASIAVAIIFALMFYMYNNSMYMARMWGGSLTISTPDGGIHISSAWKGTDLWIETYYPKDNKCIFKQQSDTGFTSGEIVISPCNYEINGTHK